MFNELRPLGFGAEGHPGVSVSGEIDEVTIAVNTIEINRLGPTGCVACERQPTLSCQCIYEAGLADVAPTQESYLGQPVGGELLGTTRTIDEFRFQLYYTGRMGKEWGG